MDMGHITQLAKDQLGRSKLVYHQDLTRPPGQAHLKVDDLEAGDIVFVDSGVPNSNPMHDFTAVGLRLSVERAVGATGSFGHWAAVGMQDVALPERFLLVAQFERPGREPLGMAPGEGTYAPSVLLNVGTLMGATSQFRPEGVRLNVPGTGVMPNLPPISQSFVDRILDPRHPSPLAIALTVNRSATGEWKAFLFVDNDEADSLGFPVATWSTTTTILDIRAGIGTATGSEYRASVVLLDFQIWAPSDSP